MAKTNLNQLSSDLSLGKFGNLFFTRQSPFASAKTHPGIIASIANGFKAWREQRAAAHELFGLSDRELADIGLTRQDIPTIVRIRR